MTLYLAQCHFTPLTQRHSVAEVGLKREDMLRTCDIGRTDGQTEHFKSPTERGPSERLGTTQSHPPPIR